MALKRSAYTRTKELPVGAYDALLDPALKKQAQVVATQIAQVVAVLMDGIANQEVTHFTIGTPRNRKSFLLTVNYPTGERSYIAGDSMGELAALAVLELIEDAGGVGE